jgi:hypothetical protein
MAKTLQEDFAMSLVITPLYSELLKQYSPVLSLEEAAPLLKFPSVNSVRLAFSRGKFPVRIRKVGGSQRIFLSDLAEYLETGVAQDQPLKPRSQKKRAGRPPKVEEIARRQLQEGGGR